VNNSCVLRDFGASSTFQHLFLPHPGLCCVDAAPTLLFAFDSPPSKETERRSSLTMQIKGALRGPSRQGEFVLTAGSGVKTRHRRSHSSSQQSPGNSGFGPLVEGGMEATLLCCHPVPLLQLHYARPSPAFAIGTHLVPRHKAGHSASCPRHGNPTVAFALLVNPGLSALRWGQETLKSGA
jgi:hypothetical protein